MPLTTKGKTVQKEGFFNVGKFVKKVTKKVIKGVTDTFMKPIKSLKNSILRPIRSIEDFIRMVLCLSLYLKLVFEWCSKTMITLTKYFLATPRCFIIWVLNSFMLFFQYIFIDVILNLVLQPAVYIGKALGYPFVDKIQFTDENKKILYENTNFIRWGIRMIDRNLNIGWKIEPECFNIGVIAPFPKYYS